MSDKKTIFLTVFDRFTCELFIFISRHEGLEAVMNIYHKFFLFLYNIE